jgi:uncharacterized membrane protein
MAADRGARWPMIALAVSVLLNVFLVGLTAGRVIAGGSLDALLAPEPSMQTERPMQQRFHSLPSADQSRLRSALSAHRDALRQARTELWRARIHALAVMAAPNYDPQAMTDALAAVRKATTDAQVALHEVLVPALGTISPAGRARLGSPIREGAD